MIPSIIQVVAAVIRRGNDILLVQQQGRDDSAPTWGLPGGVVEAGELLTETLAREVREETGLEVTNPGHLLYALHFDNRAAGYQSITFVFEVAAWRGELRGADPDHVVLGAHFLPRAEAIEKLGEIPWRWMREPIVAHLRGEAHPGAVWLCRRALEEDNELMMRWDGPTA